MSVENITTERLYLIPFTRKLTISIIEGDYEDLINKGLSLGEDGLMRMQ